MTSIGIFKNGFSAPAPAYDFYAVLTPVDFVASCSVNVTAAAYEVDWGSGSFTPYTTGTNSAVPTGDIIVRSNSAPTYFRAVTNTYAGIDVQQSGTLTSLFGMCFGLTSMTSFAINDTSLVSNFQRAWHNCSGLTSFPLIDVSGATALDQTWRGCSGLTSFPVIITTTITIFTLTWNGCSGLSSFPSINISSGTDFNSAWQDCSGLTSFPSLDFSAAIGLVGSFKSCTSLATIGSVDALNATSFYQTFNLCGALVSISSLDTTSSGVFTDMFTGDTLLTSPDAATQALLSTSPGYDFN